MLKAICAQQGCGKPTWNGKASQDGDLGYCSKSCRDKVAASTIDSVTVDFVILPNPNANVIINESAALN